MSSDEVESSALFSMTLELELVWAQARSRADWTRPPKRKGCEAACQTAHCTVLF